MRIQDYFLSPSLDPLSKNVKSQTVYTVPTLLRYQIGTWLVGTGNLEIGKDPDPEKWKSDPNLHLHQNALGPRGTGIQNL